MSLQNLYFLAGVSSFNYTLHDCTLYIYAKTLRLHSRHAATRHPKHLMPPVTNSLALRQDLSFLAGGVIFQPDANRTTIANTVISFAAARIQLFHDRLQVSAAMFEPYLSDLDIHHQQHDFIDVPLILEAKHGLATGNNFINMARFRLSAIHTIMAPGPMWDLDYVLNLSSGIHDILQRVETKNNQILHLYHRVDSQNRYLWPNTFGSQFNSNTNTRR